MLDFGKIILVFRVGIYLLSSLGPFCTLPPLYHVILQGGYLPSVVSGTLLYIAIIAVSLLTKISSALGEAIDPFAMIER